jgi:hypothetical protein
VNRNCLWRPLRRSESGVDGFPGIARAARCGKHAVAGLLKNPSSMLHGFDSFEGLPEAFNNTHGKFACLSHGVVPIVEDPRVKFFKGWFEETLPGHSVPRVGAYLYFDEFNDRHHELRAFDEFLKETGMKFKAVGADQILSHVIFQRIECAPF